MNPQALLERLSELGVTIRLSGPGTIALSPVNRIPDELRPEVVAHKAELAVLVGRQARTWQADPSDLAWPATVGEDPRPDLENDSADWSRLLALASGDQGDPSGVYGRLLALRACGGQLAWNGSRWRMVPLIDPTEQVSVWHDGESWEADRARYLLPRAREIAALLAQLPPPDQGPQA
ncbi:MAG TPA: hypothetical protein VMW80_09905 [Candidatus Dormibacteraeota bacterium]|nr:hypothetical protein [Candidatus Dormibacteraeota bacterium]